MESLGDTLWDVVICGTGLQQSLLALYVQSALDATSLSSRLTDLALPPEGPCHDPIRRFFILTRTTFMVVARPLLACRMPSHGSKGSLVTLMASSRPPRSRNPRVQLAWARLELIRWHLHPLLSIHDRHCFPSWSHPGPIAKLSSLPLDHFSSSSLPRTLLLGLPSLAFHPHARTSFRRRQC